MTDSTNLRAGDAAGELFPKSSTVDSCPHEKDRPPCGGIGPRHPLAVNSHPNPTSGPASCGASSPQPDLLPAAGPASIFERCEELDADVAKMAQHFRLSQVLPRASFEAMHLNHPIETLCRIGVLAPWDVAERWGRSYVRGPHFYA